MDQFDQTSAKNELLAAVHVLGLSPLELWYAYVGIGGNMSRADLDAAVFGRADLGQFQYRLLSTLLNEHLRDGQKATRATVPGV